MKLIQLFSSIVFIFCLKLYLCQRRLTGAKETFVDKRYMVYIVQSNQSSKNLDNWLCGGALISAWQVLTSASCLVELSHVYVIAGYRKYVNGRGIDYDDCTRTRKNRVVKTCVPQRYRLNYDNRSQWMSVDIGVAFVEKRYDFNDDTWMDYCSYIPKPIRVNYDSSLQEVGTDVVAFGWGGTHLRIQTDILDNNKQYLHEIASLIAHKSVCKNSFTGTNVRKEIDAYMICVSGVGNLDGEGIMQSIGSTNNNGCFRRSGGNDSGCSENESEYRRKSDDGNAENAGESTLNVPTRRQALCQNDHGGPLITWIGTEEVLIGVACTSIADATTLICQSPSIFTSTFCTGKVIECLSAMTKEGRRRCSDEIKSEGIEIQDSNVDWDKEFDKNINTDGSDY